MIFELILRNFDISYYEKYFCENSIISRIKSKFLSLNNFRSDKWGWIDI